MAAKTAIQIVSFNILKVAMGFQFTFTLQTVWSLNMKSCVTFGLQVWVFLSASWIMKLS